MSRTFAKIRAADGDVLTVVQLDAKHVEVIVEIPDSDPILGLGAIMLGPNAAILVGRALIEAGGAMGGVVVAPVAEEARRIHSADDEQSKPPAVAPECTTCGQPLGLSCEPDDDCEECTRAAEVARGEARFRYTLCTLRNDACDKCDCCADLKAYVDGRHPDDLFEPAELITSEGLLDAGD